jgi:hypothetical protein
MLWGRPAAYMIRGSMLRKFQAHLRTNVVGYVALFVALSGTAVAATRLPANSVGTRQLQNGAVTGKKVARSTLTGANIKVSTLGTVPDAAALGHRPPSAFQSRVTNGCPAGQAIKAVASSGDPTCQAFGSGNGTITGVTPGTGLAGGGSNGTVALSVDPTAVQRRVSGTCTGGGAISSIGQAGTVTCTGARVYSEAHNGLAQIAANGSDFPFAVVDSAKGVTPSTDYTTFTVSTAGDYEIGVTLIPTAAFSGGSIFVVISGNTFLSLPEAAAHSPATTTRIVTLAAGDQVGVRNASGSSVTLDQGSTLQLIRLGS